MYIFEICPKRGFFDARFDLFKEKKVSSHRRDNETLWELKRSKMEETAQYFEKRFFRNRSYIFIALPNFLLHITYEILSKSLVGFLSGIFSPDRDDF